MSTNRFQFLSLTELEQEFDKLFRKELKDKNSILVDQERLRMLEKRKNKSLTFADLTADEKIEVSLLPEEIDGYSFVNPKLEVSFQQLSAQRLKQFLAVRNLFKLNVEAAKDEWDRELDIKFSDETAKAAKAKLITAAMQYYLHTQIDDKEYKPYYRNPNNSLVYRESPAAFGVSATNQIDQETQKELDKITQSIIPALFDISNPTPSAWNLYHPTSLLTSIDKAALAGDQKLIATVMVGNDKFVQRKNTVEKDKAAAAKHAYKPELTAEGKKENEDFLRREKEQQEAHFWLHAKENKDRYHHEIDLRTKAMGDLERYRRAKLGAQSEERKGLNASINKLRPKKLNKLATQGLNDVDIHAYQHDLSQIPTEMNKPEDYAANKAKFDSEMTVSAASFATFFADRKSILEKSFIKNNLKLLQQDDERFKTLEKLKEEGAKRSFAFKK